LGIQGWEDRFMAAPDDGMGRGDGDIDIEDFIMEADTVTNELNFISVVAIKGDAALTGLVRSMGDNDGINGIWGFEIRIFVNESVF
jgi:hypothetical protein